MPEPLLSQEDLDLLNEAMSAIEDGEENVIRAEQAGIDVQGVRDRMDASKSQIRRIKTAFFPGQ